MSKLNNAITEIQNIDSMANKNQWLNKIHPLVKLIVTIFYIVTVVSIEKYDLAVLSGFMVYPILVFTLGELSFKDSLKKLRVVLPLVCFVGIFNPFFDQEIRMNINGIQISGGVISMVTLMCKGVLAVLASYLLIATTTIEKICGALTILHVPKILITQILFIYRYVILLLQEANRITQAYSLRAPNQKGIHFKVWGSLVGQLILRSMDRADDIYESMCLRGYRGEYYGYYVEKARRRDYLYLLLWIILFLSLRFLPVLELLGNIVV